MAWIDLFAVALLAGIGFTVSLLIGELSFGLGTVLGDEAKIGILVGSVLAALCAALILTGVTATTKPLRPGRARTSMVMEFPTSTKSRLKHSLNISLLPEIVR